MPTNCGTRDAQLRDYQDRAVATGQLPASGAVIRVRIPADASAFYARSAVVYLPPVWFAPNRPTLPVLVLIPGTPSSPGDWFRAGGADRVANEYATANNGFSPILIVPDVNGSMFADTECVDGPRGAAETYITKDVTRFAVDELGASPDRGHWGLVGLSAGGTCAMVLALRHPDQYSGSTDAVVGG